MTNKLVPVEPTECWCETCHPRTIGRGMILCPDCGNKRCPKATDHRNACTRSNERGQPGSSYGERFAAAPTVHVETSPVEILREIEIAWISDALASSIANIGYPVGCGIAPNPPQLNKAATALFERFVSISKALAAAPTVQAEPGSKPLRPNCYWKPDDTESPYDCCDDLDIIDDLFYEGAKVGDEYELNEAHYFPAKFRIVKIPDDTNDDYEVERISGKDLYTHAPDNAAAMGKLVTKLTAALKTIADGPWPADVEGPERQCEFDAKIARAALAEVAPCGSCGGVHDDLGAMDCGTYGGY